MSLILVVTGASGAGKTATVTALAARDIPGVQCFHFDSIGVPSPAEMEREYGGGEQWQAWATRHWFARLGELPEDVRVAVLDGQTRPQFVLEAAGRAPSRRTHVVLFDCSPEVRSARLRGPRQQPELADERMDHWAAYLREQADALGIPVVDTSRLNLPDATRRLELIVNSLLELDAGGAW
jgi:adenylate kinase family enzyme